MQPKEETDTNMQLEVGAIFEGKITGITKFGAFVELEEGKTGMVHISEVAPVFVKEITDFVQKGQMVKVKVLGVGDDGKVSLSIKQAVQQTSSSSAAPCTQSRETGRGNVEWQSKKRNEAISFEEMLSQFKQSSDEKMSALKKGMESKRGGFSRYGSGQSR